MVTNHFVISITEILTSVWKRQSLCAYLGALPEYGNCPTTLFDT